MIRFWEKRFKTGILTENLEFDKELEKIKKEIKEYKSKISQILKAEYQVEVEIEKDSIKVVDASTQKLIDAQQAFYVVGSKVKGTMSKVSKLAFASKDAIKLISSLFNLCFCKNS